MGPVPISMTRRRALEAMAGLGIALYGCQGNSPHPPSKLIIAAAANLQFAIAALTEAFTAQTGIACEAVLGSSGKLFAQIRSGAPFDLFVSADLNYPTALFQAGLAVAEPLVYAYGRLVLWTVDPALNPSFQVLTKPSIRHIAIANPRIAPYGAAAIASLQHQGLYPKIQDKLVFGDSIAQVNQFITSRAANIGITAEAIVRSTTLGQSGRWHSIPSGSYPALAQGIVLLRPRQGSTTLLVQAQQFQTFLLSASSQQILQDFGYDLPEVMTCQTNSPLGFNSG